MPLGESDVPERAARLSEGAAAARDFDMATPKLERERLERRLAVCQRLRVGPRLRGPTRSGETDANDVGGILAERGNARAKGLPAWGYAGPWKAR